MADLATLKRRYGDALVFCGGIDTQRVLPQGTPDEVTAEVRRVIGELGPGGGYLLASVHTIMNDVPAANILAMVDAVETYGRHGREGAMNVPGEGAALDELYALYTHPRGAATRGRRRSCRATEGFPPPASCSRR